MTAADDASPPAPQSSGAALSDVLRRWRLTEALDASFAHRLAEASEAALDRDPRLG